MNDLQINELYFLQRLDPFRIRHSRGNEYRSRCPFHGGNNQTALSVNFENGKFFCFACQAKGSGIAVFEQAMSKVETGSTLPFVNAQEAVSKILGTPFEKRIHVDPVIGKKSGWNRKQARDRYMYTDELGNELYSVWRFVDRDGNKITPPDHPCGCSPDSECDKCEGGRVWGSKGVRRVLYRLPDVIQSSLVFIVEGEKNANDLSRAMGVYLAKSKGMSLGSIAVDRAGVTTNPGGAMAWKPEYGFGKYFLGKVVIKLGDNDDQGRKHDADVCADVCKYAVKTFTLALPVGDGEDVSDFLESHPVEDLLKLFPKMVEWKKPEEKHALVKDDLTPRELLVPPSQLIKQAQEGGDWLVDRLIPRHGRGLVVAPPKCGKSLFFLDIAIALGTQSSVLGIRPFERPIRVGIVSREDGPALVSSRLKALAKGRNIPWYLVDKNIRVNTVEQSQRFRIDIDADLQEMAGWLKAEGIEFTVVDVLNKLHGGEENSSNEMTSIMAKFDELARLSGSDICVIHHTNKTGSARGSSSIEGWADYIFRLEADPTDEALKTLYVRTKASGNPAPKQMYYKQSDDMTESWITMVAPKI
jgi:KaiC/GvpD/RAD55 family RecA-like ATPase